MNKMRSPKLAALFAVLALALPASAFAQSSGVEGYNDSNRVAGLEQGSGGGGGGGNDPAATKSSSPSGAERSESGKDLPFTGADLGVIAGAGGLLLLLGFGLRRVTHGPSHA